MGQIRQGKLKMRPRMYFVAGSALTFIGLIASIATSVFAIGLIRFLLRSNGVFSHKLDRVISIFPWWALALAVLGLAVGIMLLRKYDFSYKVNMKTAIVLIVLVAIVSGIAVDFLGFNDLLVRKGLMRGMGRGPLQSQTR